ncbi:hypothetical protein BHE74_00015221 [Ensete ventricosum]|nr:hypothetical protein BHE74_00015221 [Ensete ventricosum]
MPWSPRWSLIPHRISVAVRQQRHQVQTMSSSHLGFRQKEATDAKKWECVSLAVYCGCPWIFELSISLPCLEVKKKVGCQGSHSAWKKVVATAIPGLLPRRLLLEVFYWVKSGSPDVDLSCKIVGGQEPTPPPEEDLATRRTPVPLPSPSAPRPDCSRRTIFPVHLLLWFVTSASYISKEETPR